MHLLRILAHKFCIYESMSMYPCTDALQMFMCQCMQIDTCANLKGNFCMWVVFNLACSFGNVPGFPWFISQLLLSNCQVRLGFNLSTSPFPATLGSTVSSGSLMKSQCVAIFCLSLQY